MVLADISGTIYLMAAIMGICGGGVAIAPGGRKVVSRMWAWLVAPRKRLGHLEARVDHLADLVRSLIDVSQGDERIYTRMQAQLGLIDERVETLTTLLNKTRNQITDLRKADANRATAEAGDAAFIEDITGRLDLLSRDVYDDLFPRLKELDQLREALHIPPAPARLGRGALLRADEDA